MYKSGYGCEVVDLAQKLLKIFSPLQQTKPSTSRPDLSTLYKTPYTFLCGRYSILFVARTRLRMSWAIVTHKSKSASHGQKRAAAAPCFHYLVIGWVRPCFSAHTLMEELLLDHLSSPLCGRSRVKRLDCVKAVRKFSLRTVMPKMTWVWCILWKYYFCNQGISRLEPHNAQVVALVCQAKGLWPEPTHVFGRLLTWDLFVRRGFNLSRARMKVKGRRDAAPKGGFNPIITCNAIHACLRVPCRHNTVLLTLLKTTTHSLLMWVGSEWTQE